MKKYRHKEDGYEVDVEDWTGRGRVHGYGVYGYHKGDCPWHIKTKDFEKIFEPKPKTRWGPCSICETTLENWNEGALCSSCYNLLYVATGDFEAKKDALKDLATRVKENHTMRSDRR